MKNPCTKLVIASISLVIMYISPVQAAETGVQDIQVSGGFFMSRGDAATGTADLEIAYGYMLSPKWQAGARLLASYALNDPIEDVWTASTSGFINYYPWGDNHDQRLQPFVGTFLGMSFSDVDNTWSGGPTVGVKYDITDATYAVVQWRYEAYVRKLDAGDETTDFERGNHILTLGLGLRW